MRFLLAGLLCLLLSPIAYSQVADGQVEVIGFGNYFRPDAWTPVKIRLRPKSAETGTYKIRIIQQDMNGRRVDYTRTISIGRSEGSGEDLSYWAYFIPRPRNNGLAEALSGGTLAELREQLTIHLSTVDGKLLDKISLTSGITSLDPKLGGFSYARGQKLILCVGETMPAEPKYESMLGVVEDAIFVRVLPRELPDNVIGYDSVDAVIWMNSDPTTVAEPATLEALRDYVRYGGKLVVSQAPGIVPALVQEQTQRRSSPLTAMLPVTLRSVAERSDLMPLQSLTSPHPGTGDRDRTRRRIDEQNRAINAAYSGAKGPFRLTRADAQSGAIVESWIDWSGDGKDKTPYLVRSTYGLGSVTWIAQDLSEPPLRAIRLGWAYVWDRIFDWKNDTTIRPATAEEIAAIGYGSTYGVDFGGPFLGRMDLTSKAAAFVFLAVLFFIGYWIIAGPGAYLMLASKKKSHLSWFAFALLAVVATGLTVVVVKLLLRGRGELRHMSLVRLAPGQPALVNSRFGLYIPEDGAQSLSLTSGAPGTVNFISPYKMHPKHLSSDLAMVGGTPYEVPVPAPLTPAENEDDPSYTLSVPYRSTLEKFSARWVGDKPGIAADVTLLQEGFIGGTMTNATGHALKNIYIGFRYPNPARDGHDDWVLYVQEWNKGAALDVGKLFNWSGRVVNDRETRTPFLGSGADEARPGSSPVVRGMIGNGERGWSRYWYEGLSPDFGDLIWNDSDQQTPRSVPMLTFFERLPPKRADENKQNRFELYRRGAREFDLSHAMAAGGLVVVAESDGPLPYTLLVDGEPMEGDGKVYVQAVLPLARDPALDAPEPEDIDVEKPATTQAAKQQG